MLATELQPLASHSPEALGINRERVVASTSLGPHTRAHRDVGVAVDVLAKEGHLLVAFI